MNTASGQYRLHVTRLEDFWNPMAPISTPAQIAASLPEYGSPRVIAELNDSYIKVSKVLGCEAWHSHADEDEMFLVLKGHLRIEMETGVAELAEGEMFVVPKGVRHNLVAEEECHILLIGRMPALQTGDAATEKTRLLADPLRSF